jgi:DNA (cytosine-5)-methyltransferase 1
MFKVIDLFAGPGGLAEGFSAVRDEAGRRIFDLELSVEKEASAFSTLRLRSFIRQFDRIPAVYYDYVAGRLTRSELTGRFPEEWGRACRETLQLELGTEGSDHIIDPLLDEIVGTARGETVLIGGPPCQAYSTAGRARNRGVAGYVARDDHRHFLYKEYIRILSRVLPAAFVMENVKGFLSAKIDGHKIFDVVVNDLRNAGGTPDSYEIFPLAEARGKGGREHVIEAERFGIPQARHRVILFGVRKDIARRLGGLTQIRHKLEQQAPVTVADAISEMPKLRSMLSRTKDTPSAWRNAVADGFRKAAHAAFEEEDETFDALCPELLRLADEVEKLDPLPPTADKTPAPVRVNSLAEWIVDPLLDVLPNHDARSHMAADLARYGFAAAFSTAMGRSAKAHDFPRGLAPEHQNWDTGIFKDRFRVQAWNAPSTTVTSHIAKDGHYFIHPDPLQCRSLTVREAARLQTFPDNYLFEGSRTEQYTQVGNAVPPLLAFQIAQIVHRVLTA